MANTLIFGDGEILIEPIYSNELKCYGIKFSEVENNRAIGSVVNGNITDVTGNETLLFFKNEESARVVQDAINLEVLRFTDLIKSQLDT